MNIDILNKENLLLICPNEYKEVVLEYLSMSKKIIDISFMTLNDYKKNLIFDYDIKAIKYLMDTENLSVNNTKEILDNLIYVENKDYKIEKLNKLVFYKEKLEKENLLIKNPLFKQYIKNKNVVVYGYGNLNDFDKSLLFGKTIEIIPFKLKDKKYQIVELNNIEEEVEYLYNKISDLLNKGIDINNIFIINNSNDYKTYFKRYNSYFNFVVYDESLSNVQSTSFVSNFIEMINTSTKDEIFDYLSNSNNELAEKLINLLNKYAGYELNEVKELILEDVKTININHQYKNVVKVKNLFTPINDNDYVFWLGFNDKAISLRNDTDYITNNVRDLVGLPLVETENVLIKNNVKSYISEIDNLYLSYCKNSPFNTYNKQTIFDENECEYVEGKLSYEYSERLNKLKYLQKLDELQKYNNLDNDLSILYKTYGRADYSTYDNRFKGLTNTQKDCIVRQINSKKDKKNPDELTLSYSSMNGFFECAFKYYLDSVLTIRESTDTYYTRIGNVCHGVLQDLYTDKNFDFESSWQKQIKKIEDKENINLLEKEDETFFINQIKEELKHDIEIVKKQKALSLLDKQKCENNFYVEVDKNLSFTGFIDKVMYKESENEILASVIDYKTSKKIDIDKDIMKHGLSLQLPSYLYLMKNASNFNKQIKFVGFYIQHIINNSKNYKDEETDLTKAKEESMKLDGISSNQPDRAKAMDIDLDDGLSSNTVKGIALKKDGELKANSKLYSDENFDELIKLVEEKIKEAGKAIMAGDFKINPKEIKGKNESCGYCPYGDICYKRVSDLEYLEIEKEEKQ